MPQLPASQTLTQLQRLFRVIPPARLRALGWILPVAVLSGLLDLASVAVIARMVGSLLGGRLADSLPGVRVFGGSHSEQAVWLVLIFVVLSWLSSAARVFLKVSQERLTAQVWRDISDRILARVIGQPFAYHQGRRSADLSAQLLVNMQRVSDLIVGPLLLILTSSIAIAFLAVALGITLGPRSLLLLLVLGVAYAGVSALVIPYLRRASRQMLVLDARAASLLQQTVGSIKDIHLSQAGPYFERRFVEAGQAAKTFEWLSRLLPDLPRFLIEPVGITLIFSFALLPLLFNRQSQDLALGLMPFLAAFAVAAVKLTPPLQDLFRAITRLRGALPEIDAALAYLELPEPSRGGLGPGLLTPAGIFPLREISLSRVRYHYPGAERPALDGIDLTIPVGSRVALLGPTGSGKSTLSALLLGHLQPDSGQMRLDGIPVEAADLPSWQACCAEVPQQIHLLDASILANVAFGVEEEAVDLDKVWESLSAAQLAAVVADMPYGLYTPVGENGVNLSGGQRQRLSMARAFYSHARFLVLDEATSSLDARTEGDVIEALVLVARRCTTLVIAHRLHTLARCDVIVELAGGRIVASGSYEQLIDPAHPFGASVQGALPQLGRSATQPVGEAAAAAGDRLA
ncbi:MAG: ABC transporter ATP-binding protein [Prochlorococcaceae cyanobacterium]